MLNSNQNTYANFICPNISLFKFKRHFLKGIEEKNFDLDMPPLHYCVLFDRVDIMEFLLQKGLDINFLNSRQESALMKSVFHGTKSFAYLLANGANVHFKNKNNESALAMALRMGEKDKCLSLLEHGAALTLSEEVIALRHCANKQEMLEFLNSFMLKQKLEKELINNPIQKKIGI